ncbi:hypothetical protein [Pseudomonas sp. AN3A02]|uniref:hypothetical protein n=1 Tax=Pseudomonas sp. AN3A02 TaxID=2719587 RepID=UPI0014322C00|nr:hypothetical protein [Pseudomonas sp. AN3A02]NIL19515.1 hypothetical protein [Pseudomonas sp. AN3A02]
MFRMLVFLVATFGAVANVHADNVSPWEPDQDIELFYTEYCSAPNLEKHFFPSLDPKQLAGITRLISEVLWADISEDLVGRQGASTKVVDRLRALGHPVAPAFTDVLHQATQEPMRSKYVFAYNANVDQRDYAIEAFGKLGKSDAQLGGAMVAVFECRIIRNVKTMDPFVARRVGQIKAISLPKTATRLNNVSSGNGYSERDCSCGGGNFCYGPRGGHYCITSGGKKAYVKH